MAGRRLSLFLMLAGTVVFLTGCWSHKELTDLALVSAMGVDRKEDGKYVVTFQIVSPANVATNQKGGGQAAPITIFSVSGDTIVEISKKATSTVSRRMYYAHTNLLVVSEELLKEEGFQGILDSIDRDQEFRTTTTIVVARDVSAADIVNRLTSIDKIPANKVIKSLRFSEKKWGEFIDTNIQEVIKDLVSPGREPIISGVQISGNKQNGKKMADLQKTVPGARIVTRGLAVIKNGKLIDWLEREEARGTMFILDKVEATGLNVDWKGKKEMISYELARQKTKVSAKMTKQELPVISVHVRAEGDIGEVREPINIDDPNVIAEIEEAVAKEIKKEIKKSIQHAQKDQADILGFGEAVHLADSKAWKRMKQEWNDVYFPKLEVNVEVDAFVRRTGIRNKPYFLNMEENQ